MEGHHADLVAEAAEHEDEAHRGERRDRRGAQRREARGARHAREQREPEERDGRARGPHQVELERGLGGPRAQRLLVDVGLRVRGQHVERKAHQLEAHHEQHEVAGARQQHHAVEAQQEEEPVLALAAGGALRDVVEAAERAEQARGEEEALEEEAPRVALKRARRGGA
nr:hypothetical protein [Deltaproteobacteria bacterium]